MKAPLSALLLATLMCGASVAGFVARPHEKAADKGNAISLEAVVPKRFGDWTELPDPSTQVINPQQAKVLNEIYSQVLTRTYTDNAGYRIMLSLAYGDDQRGGLQAHRPEVCYPAQGFKLDHIENGTLATPFGSIDVRRLITALGERNEPVTYWLTVGDQVVKTGFEKRLAEIRLGITGQIPDGLLFRVSSIDRDTGRAFAMQQKFAADMMAAVPAKTRKRLGGPAAPEDS
jgi:EpsI family protein